MSPAADPDAFISFAVQSGSNGNCIYVAAGGTSLLIDAGVSGVCAQRRLAARGVDIRRIDALLLSHDHSDHSGGAGVFHRKYGLPLYATRPTARAIADRLGTVADLRHFAAGESFEIGALTVHTQPTPHDGVDGVCFVLEHAGRRLGVLTDLGFVFPELEELLPQLDGVYLESNYDPDMLQDGPYPWWLKQRIRGDGGHLANAEAAALLDECTDSRLRWAVLAHLSESNNTPELALDCARARVRRPLAISVASRYDASDTMRL